MESISHMETMLLPIKYPCKTRKFPKLATTSLQEKKSQPNRKSTYQKEVNNKIHATSVDRYCIVFPNFDWPERLTQGRKTCQENPHKISAQSNDRIENYNCCRKTRQLRILHQNPNFIVFCCLDRITDTTVIRSFLILNH